MDVSFIGIEKILPHLLTNLPVAFEAVILVKPQFQAGPKRVGKGGIVDAETAIQVAGEVRDYVASLDGVEVFGMIDSPIVGGDGNREFLLHAKRDLTRSAGLTGHGPAPHGEIGNQESDGQAK
jgi:23S rRNA (cytidine1920-2'-O)/16S rRNA (cytidine1409-2'-O)-methyltransferase